MKLVTTKLAVLQTHGSIVIIGNFVGVLLASFGNPAVPLVFFYGLTSPLLFLIMYGSMALLGGVQYYIIRKALPATPTRFPLGPLLIIAVVAFVFLSILVPNYS